MKISKPWKILIGLVTLWVAIYPLLFLAGWFLMVFSMAGTIAYTEQLANESFPAFMIPFFCIFPIHILTIFLQIGLSAFYLFHVIKNKTGQEVIRVILGMGNFYMPFLAMPIYFFIFIWPETPPEWALQKSGEGG
jgi:hypothetical protein